MDTQEEIKQLKKRISELEEQVKKEQEFPKDGDEYWYLGSSGEVMNTVCGDYAFEIDRLEFGNIFKTKKQAEFAGEKIKVETELQKLSRPFENGKFNYYISLSVDDDVVEAKVHFIRFYCSQGTIYFGSEEKAQQAIEAVGEDRVKKYIFGMEE